MPLISIILPTFDRPASFERALTSLFAQEIDRRFEIIAIDNSPGGSALSACARLARKATAPFRFAHEPRVGVSNARNAGVSRARGDCIAFLDDDQEAPTHWLAALSDTMHRFEADVVWGPVTAIAAGRSTALAAHVETLYTRVGPAETMRIDCAYGAGNALLRRALLPTPLAFDPRANETGGEDDRLFAAFKRAERRFAWCAQAQVVEHVEPRRVRLNHALRRAFAYGQGPAETAAAQKDYAALTRHMGVGAAQIAVHGAQACVAFLRRDPARYIELDRAARGAGKVFWFATQKFYGAASVRARARENQRSSHATARSASV
jgi:hypothetical protein